MKKTGKMEKTAAEDAVKLLKDILEIPSVNGKDDEGAVAISILNPMESRAGWIGLTKPMPM